jgi:hypothetical protein
MHVTASAWVNDFREQIERNRILRTVYRSVTTIGAGAGMIWRPVSNGTQVILSICRIFVTGGLIEGL